MINFINSIDIDLTEKPYWIVEKNNPLFGEMLFEDEKFYYKVKKSEIFNNPELFVYVPSVWVEKSGRIEGIFVYHKIFKNEITKEEFKKAIEIMNEWFQNHWYDYIKDTEQYFKNTIITFGDNWKIQPPQKIRKMKLKKII